MIDYTPTYEEVLQAWARRQRDHPRERVGQALFNSLYELWPAMANLLRATKLDPFYNRARVNPALELIEHVCAVLERDY